MLKRRLNILVVLGCLVAGCGTALATTAVMPRDDEMVVESRAIVTGRVTGISTAADPSTELVYTYVRVSVNTVLKGEIAEQEIVLKELGGETSERGTLIFGAPRFEAGKDVLLYLNTWPDGSLRVHQGFLGKFDVNRDAATGRLFVERQVDARDVIVIAGSGNSGTNRSELGTYTRMVASLLETNRKQVRQFQQRYFSNAPMHAQPAEYSAPKQGSQITPLWAYLNPSAPSRWFEPDSNQSVVFYVNPTGAPAIAQLQDDMQAAMNAWSQSGGSIRVSYGGTTSSCGVQVADGINTISFNNCDNYFPASQGCSGVLAVSGIIRYLPGTTKMIGGVRYAKAIEANMSFNPNALCNFTNRAQLQEVATHEMGHALGLGHSVDQSSTMYAYVHFDNRAGALMNDDLKGITTIYPGSSGGQLSIVTSSLPAAEPDKDYSVSFAATGGAGGYHWSVISGQMPAGIQMAISGFVFGKTNAGGNFDFSVQVTDQSGNTSQSRLTLVVTGPSPALAPSIATAEFRKKKVFLTGTNFQTNATVYVDGEALWVNYADATNLITQKRKQQPGVHYVYVVNPDGKPSNTFQFFVE